jgi:hypothetical protein
MLLNFTQFAIVQISGRKYSMRLETVDHTPGLAHSLKET